MGVFLRAAFFLSFLRLALYFIAGIGIVYAIAKWLNQYYPRHRGNDRHFTASVTLLHTRPRSLPSVSQKTETPLM